MMCIIFGMRDSKRVVELFKLELIWLMLNNQKRGTSILLAIHLEDITTRTKEQLLWGGW